MAKQHMRWTVPIQMQHKASGRPSGARAIQRSPGVLAWVDATQQIKRRKNESL